MQRAASAMIMMVMVVAMAAVMTMAQDRSAVRAERCSRAVSCRRFPGSGLPLGLPIPAFWARSGLSDSGAPRPRPRGLRSAPDLGFSFPAQGDLALQGSNISGCEDSSGWV